MSILVLKFGGTSVATTDLIKSAASIIKKEYELGHHIAVVVSAMSGTTNSLINYVNDVNMQNESEYDVVVSSGEQITSGLMSLALNRIGIPSRSWQGWQLPILTYGSHKKAVIERIVPDKILEDFKEKKVAVNVPVNDVQMDDISNNKSTTKSLIVEKNNYIILISDFYYLDSANNLKNKLEQETKIGNFVVKKINDNQFRLYAGPYENFNALKSTYISLNHLGFDDLNIYNN